MIVNLGVAKVMVMVMPLMIPKLGGDVNDYYDCDGDRMVMSGDVNEGSGYGVNDF